MNTSIELKENSPNESQRKNSKSSCDCSNSPNTSNFDQMVTSNSDPEKIYILKRHKEIFSPRISYFYHIDCNFDFVPEFGCFNDSVEIYEFSPPVEKNNFYLTLIKQIFYEIFMITIGSPVLIVQKIFSKNHFLFFIITSEKIIIEDQIFKNILSKTKYYFLNFISILINIMMNCLFFIQFYYFLILNEYLNLKYCMITSFCYYIGIILAMSFINCKILVSKKNKNKFSEDFFRDSDNNFNYIINFKLKFMYPINQKNLFFKEEKINNHDNKKYEMNGEELINCLNRIYKFDYKSILINYVSQKKIDNPYLLKNINKMKLEFFVLKMISFLKGILAFAIYVKYIDPSNNSRLELFYLYVSFQTPIFFFYVVIIGLLIGYDLQERIKIHSQLLNMFTNYTKNIDEHSKYKKIFPTINFLDKNTLLSWTLIRKYNLEKNFEMVKGQNVYLGFVSIVFVLMSIILFVLIIEYKNNSNFFQYYILFDLILIFMLIMKRLNKISYLNKFFENYKTAIFSKINIVNYLIVHYNEYFKQKILTPSNKKDYYKILSQIVQDLTKNYEIIENGRYPKELQYLHELNIILKGVLKDLKEEQKNGQIKLLGLIVINSNVLKTIFCTFFSGLIFLFELKYVSQ